MNTKCWSENWRDDIAWFGNQNVDLSIILEWILGKQGGKMWTGVIWLRLGSSGIVL